MSHCDVMRQRRKWRKYKAVARERQSTCVDIEKSICCPARSKKATNGCNVRRRTTRTRRSVVQKLSWSTSVDGQKCIGNFGLGPAVKETHHQDRVARRRILTGSQYWWRTFVANINWHAQIKRKGTSYASLCTSKLLTRYPMIGMTKTELGISPKNQERPPFLRCPCQEDAAEIATWQSAVERARSSGQIFAGSSPQNRYTTHLLQSILFPYK